MAPPTQQKILGKDSFADVFSSVTLGKAFAEFIWGFANNEVNTSVERQTDKDKSHKIYPKVCLLVNNLHPH